MVLPNVIALIALSNVVKKEAYDGIRLDRDNDIKEKEAKKKNKKK